VLEASGPVVKATGQEPASTPGAAVELISALLRQSGANPPSAAELRQAGMTREVGAYLIRQGEAVQLSGDLLMSAPAVHALESTLRDLLATSPEGVSVAAVRDHLHTSRRVAVPLLERLARSRVTERVGDLHRLRRPNL